MSAPPLELLAPLRASIIAASAITSKLGLFSGAPSIHTRRPAPVGAGYPMIMIGPIVTRTDEDAVNSYRSVVVIDLSTYGEQPSHYRVTEEIADALYSLFHRQRSAITVAGWTVLDIRASGPSPAPVDDESRVGRRVTLTIRLHARA